MQTSDQSEKLSRGGLYPIAMYGSGVWPITLHVKGIPWSKVRARWTGERRPPRKGEWYLSGAVIEAWKTINDLSTPYHIAELVEVETVTKVVRILS